MGVEDSSTLTLGPSDGFDGGRSLPLLPALTILWHPDLDRVGELAPLTSLYESTNAELMRDAPVFFVPGFSVGRAVDHKAMSRDSVLRVVSARGAFELRPGVAHKKVEVDGVPLEAVRHVDQADLRRGLVLTVGSGFVFCLHGVRDPVTRSPNLGLLGSGDAIEDVRRAIARIPRDNDLVLLRGESGTGKELAAKAIHRSGPHSDGPFVSVNSSTLTSSNMAASLLFGHEKGAFTGATDAHAGFFRDAHGGTLFFDEIGFMPIEVQPQLLRVLDDHAVMSIGSSRPRKVDVRVIAATDLPLENAVAQGRFVPSLYHRLTNARTISLPPLRERREDVGLLLVAFLRKYLGGADELQRLQSSSAYPGGWLPASTVAAIARSPLAGNVRVPKGLAKKLADCVGPGAPDVRTVVSERLAELALVAPAVPSPQPAPSPKDEPRDIVAALEASGWNRQRAMKLLGVSRTTFWRDLGARPGLARLLECSLEELRRELEACGGDVARLAAKLGVPEPLLARRLGAGR